MAIHNNNSNNSKKTPLSPSRSSSSSQSSLSSLRAAVATMRDNRKEKKYSVLMLFVVFAVGANAGWFITYLYGGTGGFNRAAAHVSDISFFDGATTVAKTTTITTTTTATASSTETATIVKASQPKLADGCHHVFMDVGANVGVHGRFLYEPSKYPKAKYAHEVFDEQFHTPDQRDNRDICVFEFEPNPIHAPKLKKSEDAYKAMGWRYKYVPVGVGDETGELAFTHLNDGHYNEWGFSAFNAQQNETTATNKNSKTELIPIVRLVTWIKENIVNRTLPATVYGNYSYDNAPRVVMKLDIEGMEMKVLPDLLLSGTFCQDLDFVFGEAHNQKRFYPMNFGDVKFSRGSEGIEFYNELLRAIKIAQPHCRGSFANKDDESYLHDKVALPTPDNNTSAQ